MSDESSIFEKTYENYLTQIAGVDLGKRAETLGGIMEDNALLIPFLGDVHRITPEAIKNSDGNIPDFDVCVVLSKYVLLCPEHPPKEGNWAAYRDFKDAGPLTVFFADGVESSIAGVFSGRRSIFESACLNIGGTPANMDISYDLAIRFEPLPRIPMLLLFNDAEEVFPASCSLLFKQNAEKFLDAESLAIIGHILVRRLKQPLMGAAALQRGDHLR